MTSSQTKVALTAVAVPVAILSVLSQTGRDSNLVMVGVFATCSLILVEKTHWCAILGFSAWAFSGQTPRIGLVIPAILWVVCSEHPVRAPGRSLTACRVLALVSLLPWLASEIGVLSGRASWLTAAPLALAAYVYMAVRVHQNRMTLAGPTGITLLTAGPYTLNLLIGSFLYPQVWSTPWFVTILNAWLVMWPLGLVHYYAQERKNS